MRKRGAPVLDRKYQKLQGEGSQRERSSARERGVWSVCMCTVCVMDRLMLEEEGEMERRRSSALSGQAISCLLNETGIGSTRSQLWQAREGEIEGAAERGVYILRVVLILAPNLPASVIEVALQGRQGLEGDWFSDLLSSRESKQAHSVY